jgi:hypothetical protein
MSYEQLQLIGAAKDEMVRDVLRSIGKLDVYLGARRNYHSMSEWCDRLKYLSLGGPLDWISDRTPWVGVVAALMVVGSGYYLYAFHLAATAVLLFLVSVVYFVVLFKCSTSENHWYQIMHDTESEALSRLANNTRFNHLLAEEDALRHGR